MVFRLQPPSGGCVLKLTSYNKKEQRRGPAAFGRLCVETGKNWHFTTNVDQPPSGGCVLKLFLPAI